MLYSAVTDPELRDWVEFQSKNGSGFLHSVATVANLASEAEYSLLRPALVMFRSQYPEPNSRALLRWRSWLKASASNGSNLGTFAAGTNPYGVAFDGANIWVTNAGSGTVSKE